MPDTPAAARPEDHFAEQRRRLGDPRYREAWKAQYRLNYTPRRENSIRLLGFTPAQADAWIELLIEQELARAEAASTAMDEESLQHREEMFSEAERRYEEQALALVGETQYEKLRRYMESTPTRNMVDRFRNQLGEADVLRDDQVEPLIAALHAQEKQMGEELGKIASSQLWEERSVDQQRRFGARHVELMADAQQRMHAAASQILTTSQLRVLDAMLKRDLARTVQQQEMAAIQLSEVKRSN